jgi:hypothetical protein
LVWIVLEGEIIVSSFMQDLSTVAVLANSTKARVVKLWLEMRLIGGIRALKGDK